MDLKYVWIKEYKNLVDIDFNFDNSGTEKFEFVNQELIITEGKSKQVDNFFSENIKGLTVFVGKNGSGKTNLSEFMNLNLAHARNGAVSINMTGDGLIVVDKIVFIQQDIVINNADALIKSGYKIIKYENAPLDISQLGMRSYEMEKNKYIYFNPNADFRILPMGSGRDNIINISTSYLMNNDVFNSLKHKWFNSNYWEKEDNTDLLYAYFRNEKIRESDLVLNYEPIKEFIPSIPTNVIISIDNENENQMLVRRYSYAEKKEDKTKKIEDNFDELKDIYFGFDWVFLERFKSEENDRTGYINYEIPAKERKNAFQKSFLINFFRVYIFLHDYSFPKNFLKKFILDKDYALDDKELLKNLEDLKLNLEKVIELAEWEDRVYEIIESKYARYGEWESSVINIYRHIEIDIKESNNKKKLDDLILITKKLIKNELHFHYQIPHQLSSGEQNLLNFYSRFYYAKNEILIAEDGEYGVKGERIVVFIDEGDLAFHPEWQRRFFKLAKDFISNLFSDREIQLILTTHSPFVLSDIPKENVIFLKRNKDTGVAEKANYEREKTFGANIYSLLSDSFFMEEGTIGEFAKGKIEWALNMLDNDGSEKLAKTFSEEFISDKDLEQLNYIIDSIGEPLIKMQLESMRDKRFKSTEVNELKKKIEDLEEQLRKQNDKDKEK